MDSKASRPTLSKPTKKGRASSHTSLSWYGAVRHKRQCCSKWSQENRKTLLLCVKGRRSCPQSHTDCPISLIVTSAPPCDAAVGTQLPLPTSQRSPKIQGAPHLDPCDRPSRPPSGPSPFHVAWVQTSCEDVLGAFGPPRCEDCHSGTVNPSVSGSTWTLWGGAST